MILVVGSKMLPKSHCMLKAKNLSFIFLEEAFSNSCEMWIVESKEKASHLKISAWVWALLNRQLPMAVEDFRDKYYGPRVIFDYNVLSCTGHVCSSFSEDEILSSRKASFDDPIVSAPATIRSSKGLSKSCYKILDKNYTTVEMGLRTTMRWGWSEY